MPARKPTRRQRNPCCAKMSDTPPTGVSPNVRNPLTISWSECVHGVMSVFKTQFRRVRGEYILSMRDAEPRCEWCVNTCSSGLCNLHESDADGTESPSAARAARFDIESVSITFSSFFSSSGLVCLKMVVSIGAVTLEMVSIATGEASLFLGQSLAKFLGSEISSVWGF